MIKKQTTKEYAKRMLYSLALLENSPQPKLQLLSAIIENIVYLAIINGTNFSQAIGFFSQSSFVFAALIVIFLLKLTFRITFRFGITLIALQIIIYKPDSSWIIPNCLLLTILTIVQLLNSIAFDYSSLFMQVESRISNKLIRMLLLMGNIIILTLVQTPTYIHLVSAVLFLGLLWSKERSLMKSEEYRAIALRFYLCAACEHLRLFLTAFLPFASTLPAVAFSFFLSQSLFALLMHYRSSLSCHQLLAKEEYLCLAFLLLRYTHTSVYDRKLEDFITSFVGESVLVEKEELTNFQSYKFESKFSQQILSRAILALLSKSDGFLQSLMCAEVHREGGRVLLAMEILQKTRMKLKWYHLFNRVILLRAEECLKERFSSLSTKATCSREKEFQMFLSFQQLLHRAASQHLRFNLYLKRTQIELSKIKQTCFNIISIDGKVAKKFEQIRNYFSASTELYVAYLVRVRGDYACAQEVLNQQQLREKQLLNCHLQEKLFIRLLLSADGLTISRVGFNSCEILGYSRSQLEGQRVQRLVPPFFRTQHQQITTSVIHGSSDHLLLFQRQTIILKGNGGYNLCEIVLKMGMGDDELFYQGYVRVGESKQHDLNSFFSVSAEGVLLQWSQGLFEQEETERTITKVHQMLEGTLGERLVRTTKGQLFEVYNPILSFKGQNPFYFYAKRIEKREDGSNKNIKVDSLKDSTGPLVLGRMEAVRESCEGLEKTQQYIRNREIKVLFFVMVLLMLGLFGSEYLMIVSANVKYNNQNFAINSFIPLIQFYQTVIHLQLHLFYSDLKSNYNYSNNFTQPSIDELVLKLQSVNQKLKRFNLGKYTVPTYNSAISYQESNYQLVQMIVADAQLYQKFSNDSFAKTAAFDQLKMVVSTFGIKGAITDYRASMLSLMASFVQTDIYYQNFSLGVSLANVLIFLFLAIRLFWKLRQVEDDTLKIRCDNSVHVSKIKDILEFIREITLEDVPIDKISEEMQVYEMVSNAQNNLSILMSEASLIRDNTSRNISMVDGIPLETVNRIGFLSDLQKKDPKDKVVKKQSYTFTKTSSYRQLVVFFIMFICLLTALTVANEIQNYTNKNVDEVNSLNNILTIEKSTTYYSHRGVIITLIAMLQKNQNGLDISAAYLPYFQSFLTFISTISMPIFPQLQFDEFHNVSINLNNLYQKSICSLTTCDPQYYDEVNLNYLSVMKKYGTNLSSIFKATLNYTKPQLVEYISTNKRYFDLVLYTEKLIREYVTSLVMNYLDSYNIFMVNLYNSKLNYIIVMIAITATGLLLFLLFIWHIFKEQRLFVQMINIYKYKLRE